MIVVYKNPGVVTLWDGTILKSGANEVDTKKFEKNSEHPVIIQMAIDGVLEFEIPLKKTKSVSDDKYLLSLKPKEAITLVEATIELPLLEKWLKVEDRAPIKKALEEQIKSLTEPVATKKEEKVVEQIGKAGPAHEELKPDFSND